MLRELRDHLASEIAAILAQWGYEEGTSDLIEINKYDADGKGLLATPIAYQLAAEQNTSPSEIAETIATDLRDRVRIPEIEHIETTDGYINFHVADDEFTTQLLGHILDAEAEYGVRDESTTQAVWDFASPNIGKPLHIGHLRNAVLGDVLGNILETQGYDLIRINWLGDWGVQFGHLLHQVANTKEKGGAPDDLLDCLSTLYQRSNRYKLKLEKAGCEEELERFHSTGQEYFAQLENGNETLRKLWRWILTESQEQLKTTYNRLGITFDIWTTESASVLQQQTDDALEMVCDQNMAVKTVNGACIIPIQTLEIDESDRDSPTEYTDYVLLKADGTTTYEMRDLALLVHRADVLDCTEMFYVVGEDHRSHFQKLFTIARKIGYTDISFTYINYSPVDLPNGSTMSTRNGQLITVTELFDRIYERAVVRVRQNNPTLDEDRIGEIAEGITVGTIRFYSMFHRRTTKITFDIDEVTTLTGDTASYIQYAATRGLNILQEVDEIPDPEAVSDQPFNEYDYQLAVRLAQYPLALEHCTQRYDTTPLAQYLLNVAQAFNKFYVKNRVLDAEQARERRLALVAATIQVLENAFEIAGIPFLQQM